MNNIWTSFKNELGFTTATIQYEELACRIVQAEHETELLPNNIQNLAHEYDLSVSVLSSDIKNRIARNYIIQVQSCVERFLTSYNKLSGSPTYGMKYDSKSGDNFLHWTMEKALGKRAAEYDDQYRICDYYRLLRNDIIHHDEKIGVALKAAYSAVVRIKQDKLHAPNPVDAICFDDQVLFARNARQLLEAIYLLGQYDWNTIIQEHKKEIESVISSNKHDEVKAKRKIENYLKRMYPVPIDGIEGTLDIL